MQGDYPTKPRLRKLLLPLVILIVGLFLLSRRSPAVVSPIPSQATAEPVQRALFGKRKDPQKLRRMVQSLVGNSWKNYSVLVRDLTSNFEMAINETVIYQAASVNKLPILAALYHQAQQGTVDLNKPVTIQAKDIQDYGSGVIRYEKPGGVYSIKTLARLMIQQSDNTAGYILSSYIVPTPQIQKLLLSWGLTQTEIVEKNETSNQDMATLLVKLLDGAIVNAALTQELSSFLTDSTYEDRLPANLPETATVYHKTGDATAALHDVGVVVDGKLRYYMGIFTAEITNEEETKALMARVSRLVYDYLRR